MAWFFSHVLLPLLGILYVPCDWLLGWVLYLPVAAAVAVVGALSALVVNIAQKYRSDQDLLGRARADLKRLKQRRMSSREAGDREAAQRLAGLSRRIGGKYFVASLRPALLTVPLIGVVAMWTGSRLGSRPVRQGETIAVRAHFEDGASGFAHFVPNEGIAAVGSAIAPVEVLQGGRQARWRFRAAGEGTFPFVVRYAGRSYEVKIPVAGRGGRPPDRVTVFNEQTPRRDQLQAVEFSLEESMPAAWWNVFGRWAGLYVLVAVICGIGFRYALRVR